MGGAARGRAQQAQQRSCPGADLADVDRTAGELEREAPEASQLQRRARRGDRPPGGEPGGTARAVRLPQRRPAVPPGERMPDATQEPGDVLVRFRPPEGLQRFREGAVLLEDPSCGSDRAASPSSARSRDSTPQQAVVPEPLPVLEPHDQPVALDELVEQVAASGAAEQVVADLAAQTLEHGGVPE